MSQASQAVLQITETNITIEKDPSMCRYAGGFKHRDFKLKSNWGKDPVNPPDGLIAMIMANELDLSRVPVKNPHPQNLSKDQRTALDELMKNKNIVIKQADKGSAVVIMNRESYIAEAERQLKDENFYKPVEKNLTKDHNKLVHEAVDKLLERGEIHEDTADYPKSNEPRTRNTTPPCL